MKMGYCVAGLLTVFTPLVCLSVVLYLGYGRYNPPRPTTVVAESNKTLLEVIATREKLYSGYGPYDQPRPTMIGAESNKTLPEVNAIRKMNERSPSGLGYMLSLHFSDQGTGSTVNIKSFLCFASELGGVRIVEPFLVGSVFGQNVSVNWREQLRLTDIFDKTQFEKSVLSKHHSQLVPYETFLNDAPRKLLVVQSVCSGLSACRPCRHEDVIERGRIFCKMNGFELIGHICLDFGSKKFLTMSEVRNKLYAEHNKSEVVLLFIRFGGVDMGSFSSKMGYRLFLRNTQCGRGRFFDIQNLKPSQLVLSSAENYMQRYLHGTAYITVMVRIELILGSGNFRSSNAPNKTEKCLNNLLQRLEEIKASSGISSIFLCLDVGLYGSERFRDPNNFRPLFPYFDSFVSKAKEGMTLSEWDETFTNASGRKEPGFIAVLQKVIASRGEVLVLLGQSSSFQSSTKEMYNKLHKNRKVIILNNSCR